MNIEPLLTPQARAVLPDTTKGCIDDIVHDLTIRPVEQLLNADAATKDRLSTALAHYDNPDQVGAAAPILITQGTADRDVPEGATQGLVSRLCALGDRVEYRVYSGLDHNNLVAGSQSLGHRWIRGASRPRPGSHHLLTTTRLGRGGLASTGAPDPPRRGSRCVIIPRYRPLA